MILNCYYFLTTPLTRSNTHIINRLKLKGITWSTKNKYNEICRYHKFLKFKNTLKIILKLETLNNDLIQPYCHDSTSNKIIITWSTKNKKIRKLLTMIRCNHNRQKGFAAYSRTSDNKSYFTFYSSIEYLPMFKYKLG